MQEETVNTPQTEIPTGMMPAPEGTPSYLVVGYLPRYETNKTRGYNIANAPGDQLTHLIYCFAGFEQNGNVWQTTTPEPEDETKNFRSCLS